MTEREQERKEFLENWKLTDSFISKEMKRVVNGEEQSILCFRNMEYWSPVTFEAIVRYHSTKNGLIPTFNYGHEMVKITFDKV